MRRFAPFVALALALGMATGAHGDPAYPSEQVPEPKPFAGPGAQSGMQYLYGSGEAAANTRTVWHALIAYVAAHLHASKSVILENGATLGKPNFVSCTKGEPLAAVFDVDETVLLNAGFEYDAGRGTPYSNLRWQQWEVFGAGKSIPTPGAVEALNALRAMHVTVIFNTNRLIADAPYSKATIEAAGLGPADYFADPAKWRQQTLYLAAGPDYPETAKDPRRAVIASHYCVIAMGGDQLGDFSDLFNPRPPRPPLERRALTEESAAAALWGNGWFVFPNPVYGTGLAGTVDQVFPAETHWPDPQPEKK